MPKISTDINLINTFLERGVEHIYPSKDSLKKKLMSGEKIKAYQGFDPTGPYLHVGHAMGIRGLRILQKLGHEVIFLVGDFTALVGDPDKTSMRDLLTPEQIQKNMEGWKQQAAQLIDFEGDNPVKFMNNFDWLSKLKLEDLIKLMSNTTVQQMIERDMFDRRLKENNPIGLQEFIYPLMQGYDSVAMEVDLEIGGTDQIFNMLMGRNLCKSYLNKEKYVRANILMDAPDALTMSKTKGNGINLEDTSANMFGKAMSYPDNLIVKGLTLLTDLPLQEIAEVEEKLKAENNPMELKKLMAYEIVKTIKGNEEAAEAQEHFEKTIQHKEIDETNAQLEKANGDMTILDFLKNSENIKGVSSSEMKRTIQQGGVQINGDKITDINYVHKFKNGDIVKFGKRNFIKIQ
ncbi:tyrosine--tRNA ligase [Patescibacteria group bacterium]